jgi:hypothetical protein
MVSGPGQRIIGSMLPTNWSAIHEHAIAFARPLDALEALARPELPLGYDRLVMDGLQRTGRQKLGSLCWTVPA